MDEVWERAVETALDGQADCASARSLTLDGAVKCYQGRLPPSALLEKFQNLEHLSIANVGVSSLEKFPHLRNLQRLILSDNRIAGGLEFLVEAGLESLRDLDLSNNRIQSLEDLEPLARLQIVSLDLYECPVTRIKDYRSKVFGLIRTLKYLDKMDIEENERPESDEEEDDEEEDEEDDPGSGEIDGEDRNGKMSNGRRGSEGVLCVDEDEESDADEEETEAAMRVGNGSTGASNSHSNGFAMAGSIDGDGDDEDVEEVEEDDLGEELYEEEGEDVDVVEVHEIDESGEDEEGIEEDENEEEEVDDDNEEDPEPGVRRELRSTDGEIDGHDHEEDDENGEIGEENGEGVEEDAEYEDDGEDEDDGTEFLVQPIRQVEGDSDVELDNTEDEADEDVEDGEEQHDQTQLQQPSSSHSKRKRGGDDESILDSRSRKHH